MKKIKLSTEMKCALIAATLVSIICIIAVAINFAFPTVYAAHADGEETPIVAEETTPSEPAVETGKDDDLATVFKNNILPYLASASVSLLGFFAMLMPYIKVRGQNKTLQGMYTVLNKSVEAYKAKEGELTVDNIATKINDNFFGELKTFILDAVKAAVKENVADTTGDIAELQSTVDTLAAQMTNLIKAATLTWGEVDGVKELLAKSPTAAVLAGYQKKYNDLKAEIEAKNADATSEVNAMIKELEVYGNEVK